MTLTQHDIDRGDRGRARRLREAARRRRARSSTSRAATTRRTAQSVLRHPKQPPVAIDVSRDPELVELASPAFGERDITEIDNDLTRQHPASRSASASPSPAGSSTATAARCAASWSRSGRPTRPAATPTSASSTPPRSTRTSPASAARLTDDEGRYRFTTVKPGPYPWRNHLNAWRPAHIHFSLFGTAFTQRLVTQMYFPSDPLFPYDPIIQSVTRRRGPAAAGRHATTTACQCRSSRWATTGTSCSTGRRHLDRRRTLTAMTKIDTSRPETVLPTPSHTVGPFYGYALPFPGGGDIAPLGPPGRDHRPRLRVRRRGRARARRASWSCGGADPDGNRPQADGSMRRDPATGGYLGRNGVEFTGWGRIQTDADGHWYARTLRPGARGPSAPYLSVCVFARGLLAHLFTRIYLPGDAGGARRRPAAAPRWTRRAATR